MQDEKELHETISEMSLPVVLLTRERLVNIAEYQSEKFNCSMYVISSEEAIQAAYDTMRNIMDAEEFNRAVKAVVGGRATAAEALRAAAERIGR